MRKTLIDVLFMSEKRKETLLLLQDETREMNDLLRLLNTNRQSLLPQIRILEEHCLVTHHKDTYKLTTIGKLIVNEMAPLVSTTEVLDIDIDYWGTHNLDFIPPYLLERITELQKCKVMKPRISEMFEINKDFVESAMRSNSICLVSTVMHPAFPSILSDFIRSNRNVQMIISNELFIKFKEEWFTQFKEFIDNGSVKLYLYTADLKVATLAISDSCFILRLFSSNDDFSNEELICSNPKSHRWSKDLFEHYLEKSTLISQI